MELAGEIPEFDLMAVERWLAVAAEENSGCPAVEMAAVADKERLGK